MDLFNPTSGSFLPKDPNDPNAKNILITKQNPVLIKMKCAAKQTFQNRLSNGNWVTVAAPCVNGFMEFYLPVLPIGDNDVQFRYNEGDPIDLLVRIDQTIPNSPGIDPALVTTPVVISNVNTYPISGTCSESGSSILISFTDMSLNVLDVTPVPVCQADGTWSAVVNLSSMEDGPLNMSVTQRDLAGNLSTPSTVSLNKDTAVHTLSFSSASQVINEDDGTFTMRVSVDLPFAFDTYFNLAYTNNTTFTRSRDSFDDGVFTLPGGSSFVDIPITVTDNTTYEGDKLIELSK